MIKSEAFSSELTGHVSPQHPPSPPPKKRTKNSALQEWFLFS